MSGTGQTGAVRIMLLTAGTRGDIEPFVALARYAAARGHEVRLGMSEGSALPPGVDAVGLDLDFRRVLPVPGRTPWAVARHLGREVRPGMALETNWPRSAAAADIFDLCADPAPQKP